MGPDEADLDERSPFRQFPGTPSDTHWDQRLDDEMAARNAGAPKKNALQRFFGYISDKLPSFNEGNRDEPLQRLTHAPQRAANLALGLPGMIAHSGEQYAQGFGQALEGTSPGTGFAGTGIDEASVLSPPHAAAFMLPGMRGMLARGEANPISTYDTLRAKLSDIPALNWERGSGAGVEGWPLPGALTMPAIWPGEEYLGAPNGGAMAVYEQNPFSQRGQLARQRMEEHLGRTMWPKPPEFVNSNPLEPIGVKEDAFGREVPTGGNMRHLLDDPSWTEGKMRMEAPNDRNIGEVKLAAEAGKLNPFLAAMRLRTPDGERVFTGANHGEAYDKAVSELGEDLAGRSAYAHLGSDEFQKMHWGDDPVSGFVDKGGSFLTRNQARATLEGNGIKKSGPLTAEELGEIKDQKPDLFARAGEKSAPFIALEAKPDAARAQALEKGREGLYAPPTAADAKEWMSFGPHRSVGGLKAMIQGMKEFNAMDEPPGGRLNAGAGEKTAPFIASPAVKRPTEITGSKDLGTIVPATVNGRTVADWGPSDFSRFGEHFGVEDLGKASKPTSIRDDTGRAAQVPSSFLGDGPAPSYWDQLALKAQGLNPERLPQDVRNQIHDRMVAATTPGDAPTNEHVFNGTLMGLTSPNNPLTPNELAVARTMAKSPQDIAKLAEMTPWSLDQAAGVKGGPETFRQQMSADMTQRLGLNAAERGGLGVTGSADWTRISDAAKMFTKNPDFFRYDTKGANAPRSWEEHVGRIASQVPGLSFKTGSFGNVWQNPAQANISAMDRHMASEFRGNLLPTPEAQANWERAVVDSFNKARGTKLRSIDEMLQVPGGTGHYGEKALQILGNHLEPKFRLASGEVNPRLPAHLAQTSWVREPEKVLTMSPAYTRALEANARRANEGGRGIFSEQWRIWDAIRQRLEPHEIMRPDLSKIGRMNLDQLKASRTAHNDARYLTSPNEVAPVDNPASLAMFSRTPPPIPFDRHEEAE
jgi:hypothetical protein